ncbi:hypothetical protein [Streptococcus merionis]|uniref:hypothetical protein n=1 Tax=Streptococcus merionis TaxID=400065 RepID=UPI0026E9E66E|nr:hypothetical protein [Streptococcus merionis]
MREQFPLVGDDETIIAQPPIMELYDDRDLISNIQGPYEEPVFVGEAEKVQLSDYDKTSFTIPTKVSNQDSPYDNLKSSTVSQTTAKSVKPENSAKGIRREQISYTQAAREQARADLRQKRSAPYLNFDKPGFKSKELPKPKPTQRELDKEQMDDLMRAASRLHQSSYILADINPEIQLELPLEIEPSKKNTYDFLKTSQVYNYQENRQKKEKKVAQELNLTRFEQWKK